MYPVCGIADSIVEYPTKNTFGCCVLLALVTLVAKTVVEWRMKKETEMLNTVLAPEKTS